MCQPSFADALVKQVYRTQGVFHRFFFSFSIHCHIFPFLLFLPSYPFISPLSICPLRHRFFSFDFFSVLSFFFFYFYSFPIHSISFLLFCSSCCFYNCYCFFFMFFSLFHTCFLLFPLLHFSHLLLFPPFLPVSSPPLPPLLLFSLLHLCFFFFFQMIIICFSCKCAHQGWDALQTCHSTDLRRPKSLRTQCC